MAQTKLGTGFVGEGGKKPIAPAPKAIRSMGHLIAIVQNRGLQPELQNEVLKIIKGYPDGSLDYAYNNLDNTIFQCQQKLATRNVAEIKAAPEEPKEALKPSTKWRTGMIDDILNQE